MAGTTKSIQATKEMLPLMKQIETMLETVVPPLTYKCCIFKVSSVLRKMKESAYTPSVISIGPFHRNKVELQFMQKQKVRYLNHVLKVYKVALDDLLTILKDSEEDVRKCYEEYFELPSNDFVMMVLLDAVFVVEFFRRYSREARKDENDEVLYKSKLWNSICDDLIILENQLPFFVLERVYKLISPSSQRPFLDISCRVFSHFNKQNITLQPPVLHITDLIRKFHLPEMKPLIDWEPIERTKHSAKELKESGINFKASSSECLLDISFTVSDGVFLIPRLAIGDNTESRFRNMMALEQYMYPDESYICDYASLMDTLIYTYKDVELLVQKGIVQNNLGDHEEVAALFNNLNREIMAIPGVSYFNEVDQNLDTYYKKRRHKWQASFKRDYLSTPWQIASVVGAAILLVLTCHGCCNERINLVKILLSFIGCVSHAAYRFVL